MCGCGERCIFPVCNITCNTNKTSQVPEFKCQMPFSSCAAARFAYNLFNSATVKMRYLTISYYFLGNESDKLLPVLRRVLYGIAHIYFLSLIHISEPTRLRRISYAVFCLK